MKKRIPRPKNLTITSINYNLTKDNNLYEKLIYILIMEYVTKGFTLNQSQISIHQMSMDYNIPIESINKYINQIARETGSLVLGDDLVSAHRASLALSLNSLFDTKGLIRAQVALLLESQGAAYKPYVSSTVNQALKMLIDSDKSFMDWADKMMPKNSEITNLILNNTRAETLSSNEAIKYMRQIALPASNEEDNKALQGPSGIDQGHIVRASLPLIYEEYEMASLPNVKANGDDAGANLNVKAKRILEDPKTKNQLGLENMDTLLEEDVTFEDIK